MKRKSLLLGSMLVSGLALASCGVDQNIISSNTTSEVSTTTSETSTSETTITSESSIGSTLDSQTTSSTVVDPVESLDSNLKHELSSTGYVDGKMNDYSKYEGTSAYVKVSNATELLTAIKNATSTYSASCNSILENNGYVVRNNVRKNETNWTRAITKGLYLKNADGTYTKIPEDTPFSDTTYTSTMTYYEDSPYSIVDYTQTMESEGSVHVIEITDDIDLGYKHLSTEAINTGVVSNFTKAANESKYTMSSMFKENGMSQIAVQRVNNLLIYSKNGAKLTHGGFKVNYSKNVTFRNIDMDEMWQWEDSSLSSSSKVGDYDAFGWAYFKIGFSDEIWIDHCSFGKSYDGQIDISNSTWDTMGTYSYAAYGASGTSDVHISWCDFHAGSDDKDGYIYKMMSEIEEDYQAGNKNYLYYNALRDAGASFEDILYGIAIPQKKAFLDGDSGDEYFYNLNLRLSIANCYFKNIEDRIPKVRGGVCYMYNCIVNNLEYMTYRTILSSYALDSIIKINSTWKCGLVSQCIVCGNGGSVAAKNCEFMGINSLLKDNDSTITNNSKRVTTTYNGGYRLTNCSYQKTKDSEVLTDTSLFTNASSSMLTEANFSFRTSDGLDPFEVKEISLDSLYDYLTVDEYGVGVQKATSLSFLKANY